MALTPRRFRLFEKINLSNSDAKFLLLLLLYWPTCTINELHRLSDISVKKIPKLLDFLTEEGLILRREGSITSLTGDIYDTTYQYQVNII